MVLEEFDRALPDDNDVNHGGNPGIVQYDLRVASYAKPMPIFGALFGITTARQLNQAGRAIEQATKALGRPPTQEEADAIAQHVFQATSIASYGPPIGVSVGLYRGYATAKTFRWPFFQPKNIAYSPRSATIMHIGRCLAYSMNGWFWGSVLVGGYASSALAGRLLTDPRLKELVGAMKSAKLSEAVAKGKGRASESRQTARPVTSNVDDASPTGGWNAEGETQTGFDEASLKAPAPVVAPNSWPKNRPLPESHRKDSPDQPFDAFEASPTVAEHSTAQDKVAPEQTGSAWERIRRGEKTTPATRDPNENAWNKQKSQSGQGQGSEPAGTDSYSYPKADEERSYAKDEAQKEFDARVERERRGGDFSKGNGDQKRW